MNFHISPLSPKNKKSPQEMLLEEEELPNKILCLREGVTVGTKPRLSLGREYTGSNMMVMKRDQQVYDGIMYPMDNY